MIPPLSEDEIKHTLRSLKLGKYETKVYLTLLKHGPQDYKELIKRSDVPYGKIYYTLNSLIKKGWVKNRDQKPKIFYSTDPEEPLIHHLLRIKKEMNTLERSVLRIMTQLKVLYNNNNTS
jgi:sugar-specific transcriptional regulator TrmB